MKILKHRADVRSLLFLALALMLLGFSLTLALKNLLVLEYFGCLIFGIVVVFLITLLNHNHQHHPTFHSAFLNRITDHLISLCIGAPSTRLHVIHNFNHHRYYRNEKDWTNYKVHARSKGMLRIFHYVVSASKEMRRNRKSLVVSEHLRRRQIFERITLYVFIALALIINAPIFLALILPSWLGGLVFLLASNLFNHDQCDLQSDHNHSRNFLGPIENWLFLNNGFHGAHHQKPNLHWSLLPDYHRKSCEPGIREGLRQPSFILYFLRYVFKNQI